MTWLTPVTGAILAAALIPPLLLLYFLKLRRRPQAIASTLLWQRSVEDLHANAPFQKLRRNLLLFLQLLALLLLVLSVMQPQIQATREAGGRSVLLIDNSASMSATDIEGGVSRLEEAKQRARERIEAIYGAGLFRNRAGETMIVGFADKAQVYASFSRSKQELLAAIDRIQPTHGQTNLEDALKLARAYTTTTVNAAGEAVSGGDPPTLELFSDGQIADLASQVLRNEALVYHRIGGIDTGNVGISTIAVERPYDQPTAVSVFAALLNFGDEEIVTDVALRVDGAEVAIEEIRLPPAREDEGTGGLLPGGQNVVFTPFEQPRGAVIEVASLHDDPLSPDDAARLVVPPPKRLRVALVAPKSFLLRTALEGMALAGLDVMSVAQFDRATERGAIEQYDVVVIDNDTVKSLPAGRFVVFGPAPPIEGLNEFGDDEPQVVINAQADHPLLRFVRLDRLYVANTRLLEPADDVETLVEGSQGPLMVWISRGPQQVLYLPFDPLESNWPYQRSFVTFLFNAIDYVGHFGEGLSSRGFKVGDALIARLPGDATDIVLDGPDGLTEKLTPSDPRNLAWGPIPLSGMYTIGWNQPGADEPTRKFAVNLPNENEGQIRAAEQVTLGQDTVAGVTGRASAYVPLWPYAVGLCLLLLMVEWWVYHRRTYI